MAFPFSSAKEYSWIGRDKNYEMDSNVFLENLPSFETHQQHMDYALTHAGVWCDSFQSAERLYVEMIERQIEPIIINQPRAEMVGATTSLLGALRKRAETPVTHVLVPPSRKHSFISDSGVSIRPSEILDKSPFYGQEIIALAVPKTQNVFYIEGEYAKVKPLWRKHVMRVKYIF